MRSEVFVRVKTEAGVGSVSRYNVRRGTDRRDDGKESMECVIVEGRMGSCAKGVAGATEMESVPERESDGRTWCP